MGKTAYLAIDYICNENCKFCPCSKNEKKIGIITPINELMSSVEHFKQNNIEQIVISGGEPTLHPKLSELICCIQKSGIKVILLSNSELFSNEKFFNKFTNKVDTSKITVITTLHSHIADEHEEANQTSNSFKRSLTGLLNLCNVDANIIVKHCITKHNYQNLTDFYAFCDEYFPEKVTLQMCGIDYCGITRNQMEKEVLSFIDLKPYLESMFDVHICRQEEGSLRNLYTINIPLCAADVYYWNVKNFMRKKASKIYHAYKDPRHSFVVDVENNVSTCSGVCEACKAISVCIGTYKTAFDAFGGRIIRPYI